MNRLEMSIMFTRSTPRIRQSPRTRMPGSSFDLAALEARLLCCTDHGGGLTSLPAILGAPAVYATSLSSESLTASAPVAGGVPALSNNSGATAKLFLDFDGAPAQSWGGYSVPPTPAFDQDGDASTFSDGELAAIREIWARVSEKYSPFNLNVTTVDPGSNALGKVLRVVIGGDGAWTGASYGGVSYVSSFTSGSNTAWVFSKNLANSPVYIGEATAHEAGHGFGLEHQSTWNGSTQTAEYNPGNSLLAPVMGLSYYAQRGVWWYGLSSYGSYQDDMSVIAGTKNGFGYRLDDHGNSTTTADALLASGDAISANGVIERISDADYFKFSTSGGSISLTANVAAYGAMLDLKLSLYSSLGVLVASSDTASLSESISVSVSGGSYYLVVQSEGNQGDVGQYMVSGSVPAPVGMLPAPSSLAASYSSSQVALSWTDNSSSETGFSIQRSEDNGQTWAEIGITGANVTAFVDATVLSGGQHQYRVSAFTSDSTSDSSNAVSLWIAPRAPASLNAVAGASSKVDLSWNLVDGASSYIVRRSTDGVNWVQIATVSGNLNVLQDTSASWNSTYYYVVSATNPGGTSDFSPIASATTPVLSVPNPPTGLFATPLGKGKIQLAWQDNATNETGFKIEYSTDGKVWKLLTTATADTTNYTASLRRSTNYWFRLCAWNSAGSSAYVTSTAVTAASLVSLPRRNDFSDRMTDQSVLNENEPADQMLLA